MKPLREFNLLRQSPGTSRPGREGSAAAHGPPVKVRWVRGHGTRLHLGIALAALLLAALLGGCSFNQRDGVWLTRYGDLPAAAGGGQPGDSAQPGPDEPPPPTAPVRFHWLVRRAVHTNDPRGQYKMLAESPAVRSDRPIRQVLCVQIIWQISPFHTGTDETAMNAHIGYLIQTDPGKPGGATLYYEGMGNVYTDTSAWQWGVRRFQIRHAILRLTRSDRDRPTDPFGVIGLEADLSAGPDPEADKEIQQTLGLIEALRPPLSGPAPTTLPSGNADLEDAVRGD
jgi:hypothetical protein